MPIDPATIIYVLPKPGRREAILLRRIFNRGAARLEIAVARKSLDGKFYALRAVGVGPDMLQAFAEAVPAAVGAVLAAGGADGPAPDTGASTTSAAEGIDR